MTRSKITSRRRITVSVETTTASGLPVRAVAERVGFFFEHRRRGPYGPGIWEVVLTLGTWSRRLTHSGSPGEVRATLKALVKEFKGVEVSGDLTVALKAAAGSMPTILCGLEVIEETPAKKVPLAPGENR